MVRDAQGNTHLNRAETAAAIMMWLEFRGGSLSLDENARIVTAELTDVNLSPLSEDEFRGILLDLFWELRAILRGQAGATVH